MQISVRLFFLSMNELTEYEERRENRLDKFLDHINPEINRSLKPKDLQYLELMRKAKHWRDNFFSPDQVRKMIMQEDKKSYSMACQTYADMEYIFGKTGEIDKEALRRTLLEYYHRAIQIAMKAPDKEMEKAQVIMQASDKISKLYSLLEGESNLSADQLMPPNIQIVIGSAQTNNNTLVLPQKYDASKN